MLQGQGAFANTVRIDSHAPEAQASRPIRRAMTRICARCRRIKASDGTWQSERRIPTGGAAIPSHGICPDCCQRLT